MHRIAPYLLTGVLLCGAAVAAISSYRTQGDPHSPVAIAVDYFEGLPVVEPGHPNVGPPHRWHFATIKCNEFPSSMPPVALTMVECRLTYSDRGFAIFDVGMHRNPSHGWLVDGVS
jgi:hypothetical protein